MYKVIVSKKALKELKKLDKTEALLITTWIRKNLEGCSDPRKFGKGLSVNLEGCWRYRVGSYRIIAEINQREVIVLVLSVGHRKNIYKQ